MGASNDSTLDSDDVVIPDVTTIFREVETPAAVLQVIDDLDAHCVLSHPVKPMRADPL